MSCFSQENKTSSYFDLSYYKGNIAVHNMDILHLIKGHPEGYILSWSRKTDGSLAWEERYNYPEFGFSYIYQNMKNEVLGNVSALCAHYNFYFFRRSLMLRLAQGLAYTNNPYDKFKNFRNVAFGSNLLSSTFVMLNYKRERIINRFGVQAGMSLIHYSNASSKSPNTGTNTVALNIGLTYNLSHKEIDFQVNLDESDKTYTQPIKYNFVASFGLNESDVVGSGQFPFYILSGYLDKRINRKSAFQFGAEFFFSNFLKELIYYQSVSGLGDNVTGEEDYKRVGIFMGHELFVNKTSFLAQVGYYVYYPFDFEERTYLRIGFKRYINNKWFGALTLKSHGFKAEALEFGIGIRL